MRWVGHVARIGKKSAPYRILVRKPPGARSIARPRLIWEDNIKLDVKAIEWEGVNWINLTGWGQVLGICGHVNESSVSIKCAGFVY